MDDQDLVFVAVPTPEGAGGGADIGQVEEVVSWVRAPLCIKSTVPPGTTDMLARKYHKTICFSPEFVGETPWHPFKTAATPGFIVAGVYATAHLRGKRDAYHRTGLVVALSFAALAAPAQVIVGDWARAEVTKRCRWPPRHGRIALDRPSSTSAKTSSRRITS